MMNIMTVRAPEKLQEQLKNTAKEQGLTRNALILNILWEWTNKRKKEDVRVKESVEGGL